MKQTLMKIVLGVSNAEKVLNKYEQHFNLKTISFNFSGETTLENGEGYLVFIISGKHGDDTKQHKMIINYGDGQVGIDDDEWIPKEVGRYDILDRKTNTVIPYSQQVP